MSDKNVESGHDDNPTCPGGAPNQCAARRSGLACGECDGYVDELDECKKCEGSDGWVMILFLLILFIVTPGCYYFVNSKFSARMSTVTVVCVGFGSLVTMVQMTTVLSRLSLAWPEELQGLWAVFAFFAFDIRFMKPACVLGTSSGSEYVMKLALPLLSGCWLFTASFLTRKLLPGTKWVMTVEKTFNTFGTLYQAVFISVVMVVLQPMRCYPHPNDKKSMVGVPDILCDTSDHIPLLILSVLALLGMVISFLVYFTVQVVTLPAKSKTDARAVIALKYMVYRFRPSVWYWGVVFLARNLLVAFATVIDPSKPFNQLLFLGSILATYLTVQCNLWPWRTWMLNVVDALSCACMLGIILASTPFALNPDSNVENSATIAVMIFYILCISIIFGYFAVSMLDWIRERMDKSYFNKKRNQDIQFNENLKLQLIHIARSIVQATDSQEFEENFMIDSFVEMIAPTDQIELQRTLYLVQAELLPFLKNKEARSTEGKVPFSVSYNRIHTNHPGDVMGVADIEAGMGKAADYTSKVDNGNENNAASIKS